jgi:hypothetical protein
VLHLAGSEFFAGEPLQDLAPAAGKTFRMIAKTTDPIGAREDGPAA